MSFRSFERAAHARSWARQAGLVPAEVECPKDRFQNLEQARAWAAGQGFATDRAVETPTAFRFEQFADGAEGFEREDGFEVAGARCRMIRRSATAPAPDFHDLFGGPDEIRYADGKIALREVTAEDAAKRGYRGRAAGEEPEADRRLYEVAIGSEAEVERWFGLEVLGHGPDDIDMTRAQNGMAVLVDHRGDQVGVIEPGTFRVDDDKVSRGYARFSRTQRGQDVETDVRDQIRQNGSVGYFVLDARLVEARKVGEDSSGRAITVDVWRVRWQPAEYSIVSVPADMNSGPGRSAGASRRTAGEPPVAKERVMGKKFVRGDGGAIVEVDETDPRAALTETQRIEIGVEAREKQMREIDDMCEGHGVEPKLRRQWMDERKSPDDVAKLILASKRTTPAAQPSAEEVDLGNERDLKSYSFARAILKAAQMRDGTGKFDGLEAEVHQEIDRKLDANIKRQGGVFLPMDTRSAKERKLIAERRAERSAFETRTLNSKVAGKGGELIFEEAGELIEILRETSVLARLGARIIPGLSAPVSFPKHNGRIQAFWVGENPGADVAESDLNFGLVNLQAKTIQASTSFSRQWLAQSGIDGEGLVRRELGEEHALLWDRTGLHGEGAAGEPTGIYKAPDVNVRPVGGVPDLGDVIDAIGATADKNALDGTLAWVTTPLMAAKLRQILEFSAAGARTLWDGPITTGTLGGYPAISSNQVSKIMTGSEDTGGVEHGAIFGNWRELLVGMFLGMEIIVDPFAKKKRGLIEVTSFQMVDIALRHGESFTKWTGATLT